MEMIQEENSTHLRIRYLKIKNGFPVIVDNSIHSACLLYFIISLLLLQKMKMWSIHVE